MKEIDLWEEKGNHMDILVAKDSPSYKKYIKKLQEVYKKIERFCKDFNIKFIGYEVFFRNEFVELSKIAVVHDLCELENVLKNSTIKFASIAILKYSVFYYKHARVYARFVTNDGLNILFCVNEFDAHYGDYNV